MEVKCPKCRLRFEVQVVAGIREVQCNCPRCGTPFTYALTDEDKETEKTTAKDSSEESNPKRDNSEKNPSEKDSSEKKAEKTSLEATEKEKTSLEATAKEQTSQKEEEQKAEGKGGDKEEGNDVLQKYYEDHLLNIREPKAIELYQHSNRHAYIFIIGLIGAVLLVGIFAKGIDMFMGHFTDRDEALSASLAVKLGQVKKDTAKVKDNKAKTKKSVDLKKNEKEKEEDGKEKEKTEAMPQWLQGKWHVYTNDGYIVMNINGSDITVADSRHSNHGKVHCKGNLLVCKFDDGRTFTYNIDRKGHHINLQFGMEMSKVK